MWQMRSSPRGKPPQQLPCAENRGSEKVDTLTHPGKTHFRRISTVRQVSMKNFKTNSWLNTHPNDSTRSRAVACVLAKLRLARPPDHAAFRNDKNREPSARTQCKTKGRTSPSPTTLLSHSWKQLQTNGHGIKWQSSMMVPSRFGTLNVFCNCLHERTIGVK